MILHVKAWRQSPSALVAGRVGDPESPAPLYLCTGLDDDARRPLGRRHPHYRLALHALVWQDVWSAEEHRDFWTALLPLWPRERGQRRVVETEGWWAHELRRHGLDDAAIAEALALDVDTVRRRRLHDVGEMVCHEQIERPRQLSAQYGPAPPLPRVHGPNEDRPAFSYVNLPLASQQRPREVVAVEARARVALAAIQEVETQTKSRGQV